MVVTLTFLVKFTPVPNDTPPVAAAYQFNVLPGLPVARRTTTPGPQMAAGVTSLTVGRAFTVATTAVLPEEHPFAVAST